MVNFICRDKSNNVIGQWPETTILEDIRRCSQLVLEQQNLDVLNVAKRKTGESVPLQGDWTTAAASVLSTNEAAPENNQEVVFEPFPDRHAHSVIYQSWAQRGDFIFGISERLDYDDQIKFQQRLIRDLTSAVRALSGDIIDLQTRLGEALQRIDNLEQWNVTGDTNIHDLPGRTSGENPGIFPLPPAPYYIGSELISDEQEQIYYHQGYHVGGVDGGLRRYYSAQESRGIPAPTISPLATPISSSGRYERYDQSLLGPDGYEACRNGTSRTGFAETASCAEDGEGLSPPDFPVPITSVIPVFTSPIYVNQAFGTGIAVVHPAFQRIYPVTLGNQYYLTSGDNEVYYNTVNPACVPHDGSLSALNKCFLSPQQSNPFLPMPPILGVDEPCGNNSTTFPGTCPTSGAP